MPVWQYWSFKKQLKVGSLCVTEAILIKNIKTNENTAQTKDLNYWFELKEKGAITQDEYELKKKDFLK